MNRLSADRRVRVLSALVEGNSIRATCRITGTAKGTVMTLVADVGAACIEYQDANLRNLQTRRIECDEIWAFAYTMAKNVPAARRGAFRFGDVWAWTAIDADTNLVLGWMVGTRDAETARMFMNDLAGRLSHRVQITTDGRKAYLEAVEGAFGSDIDYTALVKLYGTDPDAEKRYRRFTRLTNAFSKKVENLEHAVALHFMHYNFCRPHKNLSNSYPTTPAMDAGIAAHVWTIREIVGLVEQREVAELSGESK